jgi:hypothetical protein
MENPAGGDRRVRGELIRLGHQIAAFSVWQILHDAGIDPAPGPDGFGAALTPSCIGTATSFSMIRPFSVVRR